MEIVDQGLIKCTKCATFNIDLGSLGMVAGLRSLTGPHAEGDAMVTNKGVIRPVDVRKRYIIWVLVLSKRP